MEKEILKIAGIRFHQTGSIYDFDCGHFVLKCGDQVIVKTEQGLGLGQVVRAPIKVEQIEEGKEYKKIFRMANEADLDQFRKVQDREKEAFHFCLERIKERKLPMKLVRVECFFDGSKVIFYFTADGRIDFRELVKDLVHRFHTRIEMRQIGVRNEAKLLGGLGPCGRELCCSSFLPDFAAVSVKMAKEQNLPLNPTKISGICGRLMCCLTYEYETYQELKKDFPKIGKTIPSPLGPVKVLRQNIMDGTIVVETEEREEKILKVAELCKKAAPLKKEKG
ncbi:MAG: stage 0 sporulation family protein [Desulfobacterota bacterium]|jgi:cell fate regulator YaaT (PSP1 superfamily)|nr:stage 0 sporulation family protein [Thermodesulfobacteriota bacterium]